MEAKEAGVAEDDGELSLQVSGLETFLLGELRDSDYFQDRIAFVQLC